VRGLVLGDRAAAEALFDRYGEMVNILVWKLMGHDDGHEDVVQQVFLNIISSIDRLEDPLALSKWVIKVTVNTAMREIRSRKYRRILRLEPVARDIPSECLGPEKLAVVRSFYAIVRKLAESERIFFVLKFVEGYTIGEIASLCGCPPTTVKRKIAKARKFFMREARKDSFLATVIEELDHEP
jgi:RNA polymerase sigma-70 factor (ECF subfamily)